MKVFMASGSEVILNLERSTSKAKVLYPVFTWAYTAPIPNMTITNYHQQCLPYPITNCKRALSSYPFYFYTTYSASQLAGS